VWNYECFIKHTWLMSTRQRSNGLLEVNDEGNAIMRVETTPRVSGNRMSVRITTSNTFTGTKVYVLCNRVRSLNILSLGGIFVMDAVHMPTGCGTWP
jgi:hypothetical protein